MSKHIAEIPLSDIERLQIYINTGKKSLAEIKAETGADYIMNGGLFEGSKAVCHLRADGYTYAADPYTYWGYSWDTGPDIAMTRIPYPEKQNNICCVALLRNRCREAPTYNKDLGGLRGRTAMGLYAGRLCLYVSSDGSYDAQTPEHLQTELFELGWESAVMLDGGGSSQCDFAGKKITSSRVVHNLILVYLKKETEDKPVSKKYTVCLDPGHGPNTTNGSPDGSYKESEFTWDLFQRLQAILEKQGINVVGTRTEPLKPSLTARAAVSNKAGADLFISIHTDASGSSGWASPRGVHIFTSSGPYDAPRNKAARAILAQLEAAGIVLWSPEPKHSMNYTVLTSTNAPACLIEYGFHTNREDVALLKSVAYRHKLAEATAKGVCDFLGVPCEGGTVAPEEPQEPVIADPDEAAQAWIRATAQGLVDGTRPTEALTREAFAVVLDRLGLLD